MAYSTNLDIIDLIGTDLDTDIIDRLITKADLKIDNLLESQGLAIDPADVPGNISIASSYYAAALVLGRHMVDGTLPASYSAGDVSETTHAENLMEFYNSQGVKLVNSYIEITVADVNIYRVVGEDGERVGEYATMTGEDET